MYNRNKVVYEILYKDGGIYYFNLITGRITTQDISTPEYSLMTKYSFPVFDSNNNYTGTYFGIATGYHTIKEILKILED